MFDHVRSLYSNRNVWRVALVSGSLAVGQLQTLPGTKDVWSASKNFIEQKIYQEF